MRALEVSEVEQVSGGLIAPWQEVAGGAMVGGLGGFLTGARTGNLAFAVGLGVLGGGLGAAYVMIKYAMY